MTDVDHEWKVGDKVLIDSNRYGRMDQAKLVTVEKVTKTQFTAGGIRFKIYRGDRAMEFGGDIWHPKACEIATPERLAENDRRIKAAVSEKVLYRISEIFRVAHQDDAILIADMLPEQIIAMAEGKPK